MDQVRIFLGIHLTSGKLICVFRGCSNVERVPEAVIWSGIHVVVSPCDWLLIRMHSLPSTRTVSLHFFYFYYDFDQLSFSGPILMWFFFWWIEPPWPIQFQSVYHLSSKNSLETWLPTKQGIWTGYCIQLFLLVDWWPWWHVSSSLWFVLLLFSIIFIWT